MYFWVTDEQALEMRGGNDPQAARPVEKQITSQKSFLLMERVKRQIAERDNPGPKMKGPKHAAAVTDTDSGFLRLPSRSVPFER